MANSLTKSNSHQTRFNTAYLLEYRLVITQCDPKTLQVYSVRCQFCAFFGHEQIIGQKRQKQQTKNEKYWGQSIIKTITKSNVIHSGKNIKA